jgi:prepilin-type N-terminal cleavage/methylation domain-containing protein
MKGRKTWKVFSMTTSSQRKGFTLIELLVVIAVIGILASVILVGLSGARQRGRDAKRIQDLRQIQNGLELYFSANGTYPATLNTLTTANLGISNVPADPQTGAAYSYCVANNRYAVLATLEQYNAEAFNTTINATYPCNPNGTACQTNTAINTPTTNRQYCVTI